jgi:hypothetical protein
MLPSPFPRRRAMPHLLDISVANAANPATIHQREASEVGFTESVPLCPTLRGNSFASTSARASLPLL